MDLSGEIQIHECTKGSKSNFGPNISADKYSRPRFHEREVFPSHREVVMIQNNGKNRSSDADDHDLFEYFFFFSFLIFT